MYVYDSFPGGSRGKESACNAGDLGLGRSPGEGNGNPLQYSCLENSYMCIHIRMYVYIFMCIYMYLYYSYAHTFAEVPMYTYTHCL